MPSLTVATPSNRIRRLGAAVGIGAAIALAASGVAVATAAGPAQHRGASARSVSHGPTSPFVDANPYYEVSPTGSVWPLSGARYDGDVNATAARTTIVGIGLARGNGGYWEVSANGRVWAFGSARYYGSPFHSHFKGRPAGIVRTVSGNGYWVYDTDGSVHAFGDARYYGSLGGRRLDSPIVDMVGTTGGGGYWLVSSLGRVAAYGNATSHGDFRTAHITSTIAGLAVMPRETGYWLVGTNGQVWAFGAAHNDGNLPSGDHNQSIASIVSTSDGNGYWMVAHDGDIHRFGDAVGSSPPELAFVHTIQNASDRAVEWAMEQRGKPYIYGGTGPQGFDCSGLTMMSWHEAGVTIPRVADDQYIAGKKTPISQLANGDLVYWATNTSVPSTVYHVALYLGSGNIVAAPYTGTVVQTQPLYTEELMTDGTAP